MLVKVSQKREMKKKKQKKTTRIAKLPRVPPPFSAIRSPRAPVACSVHPRVQVIGRLIQQQNVAIPHHGLDGTTLLGAAGLTTRSDRTLLGAPEGSGDGNHGVRP